MGRYKKCGDFVCGFLGVRASSEKQAMREHIPDNTRSHSTDVSQPHQRRTVSKESTVLKPFPLVEGGCSIEEGEEPKCRVSMGATLVGFG